MNLKTRILFFAALAAGAVGACLRFLMYRTGFDEKNILSPSHPFHLLCMALAGLLAVCLFFALLKSDRGSDPEAGPSACPLGLLALVAGGCFAGLYGMPLLREADTVLATCRAAATLIAAFCMVLCALLPRKLRAVHNICTGLITVFFALDMFCRYQEWSGNPQLPDYVFQILACMLLSICSYYRLAFDVGLGKRRKLLWTCLMALCLSLFCVSGPETQFFFLGGALWAGGCICATEPSVSKE